MSDRVARVTTQARRSVDSDPTLRRVPVGRRPTTRPCRRWNSGSRDGMGDGKEGLGSVGPDGVPPVARHRQVTAPYNPG